MEVMLLITYLQELEKSIQALTLHIEKSSNLFIATKPGQFICATQAIAVACASISDLYYADGIEDGRYTSVCLGGIALSPEGIEKAIEVNLAKDVFHKACKAVMENARGKGYLKLSPAGQAKRLRAVLIDAGYPRLSLRQCFRHLPVLHHAPVQIRFSFSSGGRSIRKITVEQALALLESKKYESKKSDIQKLKISELPLDTPLAQVQELPGYYKANVWHEPASDPQTIPAFLPILYPYDPETPLNRQEGLPEADVDKRMRWKKMRADNRLSEFRSDKKLNDEPYSDLIRVYGYRQNS